MSPPTPHHLPKQMHIHERLQNGAEELMLSNCDTGEDS